MRDHLTRQLELTPEQVDKLTPIIADTSKRLQEIRRESGKRVAETMQHSHSAMAPHLTPEQREKLDQMKMRHKRMRFRRGGPPPSPGDEP